MKQINRYYLVFGFWAAILFYTAFISNNVYFNGILLFFGFILTILGFAYIDENENEQERKLSEKIGNLLG